MSRRSTRLLSGGYYNSDEESDSSSITTISYRENPVKVFKKKSGSWKRRSAQESPGSDTSQAEPTLGAPQSGLSTVSRPALRSPASVPASSTPSLLSPPCPTRSKPVLHFQPQEDTVPSAVDSSGYSSSEDPCKRPSSSSGASSQGVSRAWQSSSMYRLKDAVSAIVAGAEAGIQSCSSSVVQLVRFAATPPRSLTKVTGNLLFSARMKKLLCGVLLLLILFGLWWTSLLSAFSVKAGSASSASALVDSTWLTALDAATVAAAVEAKVQCIQKEMQLRHDHLLAELKQEVKLDVVAIRQSNREQKEQKQQTEVQLQQSLADVQAALQRLQAHSESATARLLLRVSALEDQVSQMGQSTDFLKTPHITPELEEALGMWLTLRLQQTAHGGSCMFCDRPLADKMADFALESQGASVISTRCSETYRTRTACVTLFGLPLWYPSESPRTVIQGPAVLLPGKCWAFHGIQGTLVIALSHPIRISHVTLDHLPRHSSPTGRIQSAPKDFQVYGMTNETEEGTLLGTFQYQEDGPPTQTFSLSSLTDAVYRLVELRVMSNWGQVQYTCLYRFRVHGQMLFTDLKGATA